MPAPIDPERRTAAYNLLLGTLPTQAVVATAIGVHPMTISRWKAQYGWVLPDLTKKEVRERHARAWAEAIIPAPPGESDAMETLTAEFGQDHPEPAELEGQLAAGAALLDRASSLDNDPSLDGGPAESLDVQVVRLGRVLSRQMERILRAADRAGGMLTKSQADTLAVIMRLAERFEALASQSAIEKEKRSDAELAEILNRVDERTIELAGEYAARLVAGETHN